MKNYYWTIIAPEGKAIELIINELRIEGERNCLKDFLKIYDGESTSSPVLRIYCGIMNPYPFKSSGPKMYLHFRSDDEIDERGFRIAWKAVDVITTTASTTTQGDSEPEGQCRVFWYVFQWTSNLKKKVLPILARCTVSTPPENVRKSEAFWRVQGVLNGMEYCTKTVFFWVNVDNQQFYYLLNYWNTVLVYARISISSEPFEINEIFTQFFIYIHHCYSVSPLFCLRLTFSSKFWKRWGGGGGKKECLGGLKECLPQIFAWRTYNVSSPKRL